MAGSTEHLRARLQLVNAAHHFLLTALPLRQPDTREGLATFLRHARTTSLGEVDIDMVLVRCLVVLDRYMLGRLPSLIARYSSHPDSSPAHCVGRFQLCIEELLEQPGVGHPLVEEAIRMMRTRYSDPHLTQADVSAAMGVHPTLLSTVFNAKTGQRFREYLTNVRLDHAASLFAAGFRRIKDVWVAVGYNHASNFDHDFKRRFGLTPREYRARAPLLPLNEVRPSVPTTLEPVKRTQTARKGERVLVVDDDETTRMTVTRILMLGGYAVQNASTGQEGLHNVPRLLPAAILLDYRLPDMDGLECLRALRELPLSRQPGVALFTADWEAYDQDDEARSLGAKIVSKLCDVEEINTLVASLIDQAFRMPSKS